MTNFLNTVKQFHNEESGQDLIEYALVAALIALAATAGMKFLSNSLNNAFSQIGTTLSTYVG